MNLNEFRNKAQRIKGWRVLDPWGTRCVVGWIDRDAVWCWYEGLDVPFERGIDLMVAAQRGEFLADKSGQFEKSFTLPSGIGVSLSYEPFWTPRVDEARRVALDAWRGRLKV